MRRGLCFSSQKHKLLKEIPKSGDENQGCILKKGKLSDKRNDFISTQP